TPDNAVATSPSDAEAVAPAPAAGRQAVEDLASLQSTITRQRPAATAGEGHQLDILVAEDNEVNQLVFTQILGETGYSFEIVGNGRKALDAFTQLKPLMILMD